MSPDEEAWVEEHQLTPESATEIALWCGGKLVEEIHPFTGEKTPGINVPTIRGVKRASVNDWVVLNMYGDFEVVNEATYAEVKAKEPPPE